MHKEIYKLEINGFYLKLCGEYDEEIDNAELRKLFKRRNNEKILRNFLVHIIKKISPRFNPPPLQLIIINAPGIFLP